MSEPALPVTIRPVRRQDAESWGDAVANIARERRFLNSVTGYPVNETRAYLERILDDGTPAVVAQCGDQIVGWCDIHRRPHAGFAHVGTLGMGVLQPWRQRGIGRLLITRCLALTAESGIGRVELVVYHDNASAIRLYESVGFLREGRKKASRRLDGRSQDELLMALSCPVGNDDSMHGGQPRFEAVTPRLPVTDVQSLLPFYVEKLGFELAWKWGDPVTHASVCRDAVSLDLIAVPQARQGTAMVYLLIHGIDAYHLQLQARRVEVGALGDRPYGMRDFEVIDPCGNRIAFGQPLPSKPV